jgi:hypothetical protein
MRCRPGQMHPRTGPWLPRLHPIFAVEVDAGSRALRRAATRISSDQIQRRAHQVEAKVPGLPDAQARQSRNIQRHSGSAARQPDLVALPLQARGSERYCLTSGRGGMCCH